MTFIIAEIAQAHEGSEGIAHSYIDTLADAGVDAVKFQTHIATAESSAQEEFRVNFSYEDKTRYDYWKRMEFSLEQWNRLKKHCDERKVEFISSPFSVEAVELLEKIKVKRYKIGSGELSNHLMLDSIAKTGKPLILSSGMSNWAELEETVHFLKPYGNDISILQCTTAYPTSPEEWGLNSISEIKDRFKVKTGFSDHSADIYACLAATALGADILEFHAVFDHRMFGPDAKASLNLEQIQKLVKGVRQIYKSLNTDYNKDDSDRFTQLKTMFGKSLATRVNVAEGDPVSVDQLESKKPGDQGVSAKEFRSLIGKKWSRNITANTFIKKEDYL